MEEGIKPFIYSGLILLVVAVAGFYFLFLSPSGTFLTTSPDGAKKICNVLENNGGGTNIVFFAERATAERYVNSLFEFEPLSGNRDSFNFYYIDLLVPKCEFYEGVALFCYSRDLIRVASVCPSDYIVAIKEEAPKIRSSSYRNVMSLNSAYTEKVFAHEFGHAFANLAEEYIPGAIPRGAKNCVPHEKEFEGEIDGRFGGCSRDDHDRSIESGIMKTLDSRNFGKLNEFIISRGIVKNGDGITGNAVEEFEDDCSFREYFLIDVMPDGESLEVISKTKEIGCAGGNGFGESEYRLFDEEGNVIGSEKFSSNLIFTDSPPVSENGEIGFGDITGKTYVSTKPFSLRIPIVEDAGRLEIDSGEQSVTVEDLSQADYASNVGFVSVSPVDKLLGNDVQKFSFGESGILGDYSINIRGEVIPLNEFINSKNFGVRNQPVEQQRA